MAVLEPYKHGYYLWKYVPSAAGAGLFCAAFGLVTIAYVWRIWKSRTWFTIPFAVGGFMQFIGYAGRAACHTRTSRLMPFVVQQNNILLAPVLYAASIYMTLGRTIRNVKGEKHSIVSPKRLTAVFLTCDILALAVQGSAAGLMVLAEYAQIAEGIVIAGLAIQIVAFGLFWLTSWVFHIRMSRDLVLTSAIPAEVQWENTMRMLYGVSALIMLRSIFRMIEFVMGQDGYLLSNEWPLYIFDTLPMLAVMGIFWKWFPSSVRSPRVVSFNSLHSLHSLQGSEPREQAHKGAITRQA
ncbi:hypothetical protein NM208_g5786 [Fusarium decemcellulare]|uniref:Uncharacterized protein n=1 Tax=Fusarium decemcellulare TaxID=57161 RepID=A0ACC1SFX9_9HYPO|nr:hypothetical protein NM208_g5786 [Fusarium decemcellulare]